MLCSSLTPILTALLSQFPSLTPTPSPPRHLPPNNSRTTFKIHPHHLDWLSTASQHHTCGSISACIRYIIHLAQRRYEEAHEDIGWLVDGRGDDEWRGHGEEVWVRGKVGKGQRRWLEGVGGLLGEREWERALRFVLDWAMREWEDGRIDNGGMRSDEEQGSATSDDSTLWDLIF